MLTNVNEHWQHTEYVENEVYEKFRVHSIPITPQVRIESNSQMYKMGGNSIVVQVLEGIFRNLVLKG